MTLFEPELPPTAREGPESEPVPEPEPEPEPELPDSHTRGARTVRVVLGLAYDGSMFRGFAVQPGQHSVAGDLLGALETVSGMGCRVTCAGRTDAGVHAHAQVVHVDLPEDFLVSRLRARCVPGETLPTLAHKLTKLMGPSAFVYEASVAPLGFDARRSATYRRYRYEIDVGLAGDPLRRNVAWHVASPLDVSLLRLGSDALIGEHDFAGFCRRAPGAPSGPIIRRVTHASWAMARAGTTLRFEIQAGSFCHQMVRSIVGCLVAIGQGRGRPSDMRARLLAGSRERAAQLAPPCGLSLVEVGYPDDLGGARKFPGPPTLG